MYVFDDGWSNKTSRGVARKSEYEKGKVKLFGNAHGDWSPGLLN